jgi:SHS2 domain-containing protein
MPAQVSVVDQTADIGLRVVADKPAEAYCAIAEAMFGTMVNLDQIQRR